jgi:hypothetical protein
MSDDRLFETIEKEFSYHTPTPEEVARMNEIRAAAKELVLVIARNVPACADRSAAFRKIREASVTANAAIVLNRS